MQFNQSTLNSDHLAGLEFFPSTCLCRVTHDNTSEGRPAAGRNLCSIVPVFLRVSACFLFSRTYMHSESLAKHLHSLATLTQKSSWKKHASENRHHPFHHNHTKMPNDGPQEVHVVLPGLMQAPPSTKIRMSWQKEAALTFFCKFPPKVWALGRHKHYFL